MTSDNARQRGPQATGTTSDNAKPVAAASADREPVGVPTAHGAAFHYCANLAGPLPPAASAVLAAYGVQLAKATMLDEDTRRAYTSRVRGYLAWLAAADVDGDPLAEPGARDGAVRDYRAHLQTVAKRKPATINTTLAASSGGPWPRSQKTATGVRQTGRLEEVTPGAGLDQLPTVVSWSGNCGRRGAHRRPARGPRRSSRRACRRVSPLSVSM
jgi:hypothetical protein